MRNVLLAGLMMLPLMAQGNIKKGISVVSNDASATKQCRIVLESSDGSIYVSKYSPENEVDALINNAKLMDEYVDQFVESIEEAGLEEVQNSDAQGDVSNGTENAVLEITSKKECFEVDLGI